MRKLACNWVYLLCAKFVGGTYMHGDECICVFHGLSMRVELALFMSCLIHVSFSYALLVRETTWLFTYILATMFKLCWEIWTLWFLKCWLAYWFKSCDYLSRGVLWLIIILDVIYASYLSYTVLYILGGDEWYIYVRRVFSCWWGWEVNARKVLLYYLLCYLLLIPFI